MLLTEASLGIAVEVEKVSEGLFQIPDGINNAVNATDYVVSEGRNLEREFADP